MGCLWSDFNKIRNKPSAVGMTESKAEYHTQILTKAAFLEIAGVDFTILMFAREIKRSIALNGALCII